MFARLSRPIISGTNGATALHIVKKELISFFIKIFIMILMLEMRERKRERE